MPACRASLVLAALLAGFLAQPVVAQEQARHTDVRGVAYHENEAGDDYIASKCVLNMHLPPSADASGGRPADGSDEGPDEEKASDEGFATVVWFHPGGLSSGEPWIPDGLRGKDIAVVSAGYRLHPSVSSPVYLEDAAASVVWVLENIARYGGDPRKVFVAGHSAGGYLASMIGLDDRWLGAHDHERDELAGIVSVSGHSVTHFTVRAERGIPGTRAIVDDMAPLYHVRADAPPLLLISGDREQEMLGRYEESAFFWRMMKVAGHEHTELLELDGFDHGGVAGPAMPLLLKFVRETLEHTEDEGSP